ncbi:MAG: phosphoribosyltransferase [Candidatus Bathyarchaeota archaeon]|jgi:hypoxanthine phosphoribosyltransferase
MVQKFEFEAPSWNQVYDLILNLSRKIRTSRFCPEVIVGVSRGGWLPARVLTDLLEISNLDFVRTEFYQGVGGAKEEPVLTQSISIGVANRKVLIVDDIIDTGESLKVVREHIMEKVASEARIATVFYKPWSIIVPDYFGKKTTRWVVFPWEVKETIRWIVKTSKERKRPWEEEIAKLEKAGVSAELIDRFLQELFEE